MNGQRMQIPNPLARMVGEANQLIDTMLETGEWLEEIIEAERVKRSRAKDAADTLALAESELINEATILARGKEGPLNGIAVTSKAYSHALDALIAEARQNQLSDLYSEMRRHEAQAEQASIELEQARVRFSAVKHAADLKAAILNGLTGRYQ